jgi:3-deoxy-manno-octulosonate cytidylyltransferase (CMP-KDO synthetase)
MSRSPIPSVDHEEIRGVRFLQIGIFAFRWHFFKTFNDLPSTPLVKAESVEMLQAIEHGYKVRMVLSNYKSIGVDTRKDLLAAEAIMKEDPVFLKYKKGNIIQDV